MNKKGKFDIYKIGWVIIILFIIGMAIISVIAGIEKCKTNAEKLGLKGEHSFDKWLNEYCIYTMPNGRKVNADDYKYVVNEQVDTYP